MGKRKKLKRSEPPDEKPRKRRSKNLTPNERAALMTEYRDLLDAGSDKGPGDIASMCARYGVSVTYPSKLLAQWRKSVHAGDEVNVIPKPHPGRPKKVDDQLYKKLEDWARARSFQFTYAEMESAFDGVSDTTLWRTLSGRGWRAVKVRTKPSLTVAHKQWRLDFAREHRRNTWDAWVDVDEKWFFTKLLDQPAKVPPTADTPVLEVQHTSHVPKIMFLCAVAKPVPEHGFDGRIGIWRVAVPYEAKRNSKNHKRGEVYLKDVTMDASIFRAMMVDKVFRAIRRKLHWVSHVTVQVDNASPHVGSDTINFLNDAGTGRHPILSVVTQPAQSPDTNCLDLGFFRSIQNAVNVMQRQEHFNNVSALCEHVNQCWRDYPAEKITRIFEVKTRIMQEIIKDNGDNKYKVPHLD
jgi:hypothetical protein